MFITPGILTDLKVLPSSGKSKKYLRDTASTVTPCCKPWHYFFLARSFSNELKNLSSTQFKILTSKQVLLL